MELSERGLAALDGAAFFLGPRHGVAVQAHFGGAGDNDLAQRHGVVGIAWPLAFPADARIAVAAGVEQQSRGRQWAVPALLLRVPAPGLRRPVRLAFAICVGQIVEDPGRLPVAQPEGSMEQVPPSNSPRPLRLAGDGGWARGQQGRLAGQEVGEARAEQRPWGLG